jgi:hypothetical protein
MVPFGAVPEKVSGFALKKSSITGVYKQHISCPAPSPLLHQAHLLLLLLVRPQVPSSSKPPLKPLTGFQSALEHTGIPRSVLTWKPRLPSRNWSIFLTISGTLFYLYYDDRKQCRIIKEDTIKKVEYMGKQVLEGGSLADVRKIKVYGARCPEDGDDDRALRYFRKYMKVRPEWFCTEWS